VTVYVGVKPLGVAKSTGREDLIGEKDADFMNAEKIKTITIMLVILTLIGIIALWISSNVI
tara:strand:- start:722 stop:904 length:183 start_codon:yes stop_codon:yes gene_type:complete